MTSVCSVVSTSLALPDGAVSEHRPGELSLEVAAIDLPELADKAVARLQARLMSLFATDARSEPDGGRARRP